MPNDLSPADSSFRVALLGIYHESNTFIDQPTTLENFRKGHWLTGEDIRKEYKNAFHEIGGMLEVMEKHNIQTIPVMYAEATPGGVVSRETYELILNRMMDELDNHLPVDACLVVPHGAGVAEGYNDMDGHWLQTLRNRIGKDVPVVGTLDPHANVSKAMTDATDALISYKTNPHVDQRETGKAAAELLVKHLQRKIKPVQLLVQTPVAISIEQQNTSAEPCLSIYSAAKELLNNKKILSVSVLLGFPYADVEEMGSAFIVVSDGLPSEELSAIGDGLRSFLIQMKDDCVGQMKNIKSVLPLIDALEKPILMLDMGDNIGGGSPGDSAYLLKAIEDEGKYSCFTCIFDPEAVKAAASHNINDTFPLQFGNLEPGKAARAYINNVTLLARANGKFTEKKPRHGGQVNYDMGEIVVVATEGGNTVMLNSLRVPPFSLSQITSFGISPENFDIIIAKGVNAPIAAYSVVCPAIVQLNTPGVTQADMTIFPFKNRRKPLFPFEKNVG